jgi:ABC-type hemin transport system ATPase subunit
MGDADRGLYELLFDRVVGDAALPERCKELILAAFDGEEQFTAALVGGVPTAAPENRSPARVTPPMMFLSTIRVRSFRGIGPATSLDLRPGPGLTVVTGRNGSGKSSFAEATELVLTGNNVRWSAKENNQILWRQGWRNLHCDDPAEIDVDLLIAGERGPITVRMSWTASQELDDPTWTRQRLGAKREQFDPSLWRHDLELYRPFLSYSELGSFLDGKPSALHDTLHRLLGLGALDAALDRLKTARSELDSHVKVLRETKNAIVVELGLLDDERARRAEKLLSSRKPDLAGLAELALGDDQDVAEVARLRALLALSLPTGEEVTEAARKVRNALDSVAEASTTETSSADAVATLLERALTYHGEHGDTPCPVCGGRRLDALWRGHAAAELTRLQKLTAALHQANSKLAAAVADARALGTPVPLPLGQFTAGVDVASAATAWQAWHRAGQEAQPAALVHGLVQAHPEVWAALTELSDAARAELSRLDEAWRPLTSRLIIWHDLARRVEKESPLLGELKKAENWLKAAAAILRDERMAPFAAGSQRVWQQLRQESSVDLGAVRLEGSSTRRRVALDVTVDGTDTAALSVMSQGELHALGLSLFLPRATEEASPFRFLMIDDPVQAMDPAKVDGLARVLSEVAQTRQVVVFTHDDRLADAVRRLTVPATVWEVCRRDQSRVALRPCADPVDRYLDDAYALAKADDMPENLRRELVATCCRGALEAAAQAKVRTIRLGRGDTHVDVEDALARARTTNQQLTLAVFDDPLRGSELLPRLNQQLGRWAANALQACKEGAHHGFSGDLLGLITNTKKLARWVVQS